MATITIVGSTSPKGANTATGTLSTVASNGQGGQQPYIVCTTCTLPSGETLTTTPPWSNWVDPSTATTLRIPAAVVISIA
jgi:hypothetical protein